MLLKPQSLENIIVAVKWNHCFNWYVTEKDIWFMDLIKLKEMYIKKFEECGIPLSNLNIENDGIERQDILVLNEKTMIIFEPRISRFLVNVSELKNLLKLSIKNKNTEDIYYNFLPSLYIDFDRRYLYSMYTEPASFEDYVPQNWIGIYGDFLNLISLKDRYWYDENEIIFDFNDFNKGE